MAFTKSFKLSPALQAEVDLEIEAGRKRYALISHIVWESSPPQEYLDMWDDELDEDE